mmetsp:Transcript_61987/g.146798  ORF Transcript_61987/g.146798 Transcript_61987/m.146798 type:complete len:82 (-) Transcript_61987:107-352(-)
MSQTVVTVAKKQRRDAIAQDLRLTPAIDLAASELKERDWCNVITCHADDPVAYICSYRDGVLGKHMLKRTDDTRCIATVVA